MRKLSSKTIEFYKTFKHCIPSNKDIAKREEEILENIINMSTKESTAYMRQYIVKLTYYRKNFLDVETAELISKMILEISF
ncbi:hypothetical protein R4M05_04590, partial [Brachyspira intermedia]